MPTKKLTIECCESVMGTWHYHLRKVGSNHALCGDLTMYSPRPLERWNVKIPDHHIPESFCSKCNEMYESQQVPA